MYPYPESAFESYLKTAYATIADQFRSISLIAIYKAAYGMPSRSGIYRAIYYEFITAKKRVELICHLRSGTKYLHTGYNILYQNVSDKSIENQELIQRVFFAVHRQ